MDSNNNGQIINYLGIATLCMIANITALIFQLFYRELPCPLCLLQRFGFIAIGFGATISLIDKKSWKYDLIILISSIFTLIVALRQVLLHIVPNDPGYGSAFLGIHFYTWSAIISFVLIISIASSSVINFIFREIKITPPIVLFKGLKIGFIVITLVNTVSTFLECGFGLCPSDPMSYMSLEELTKSLKSDLFK